MPVPLSSRLRVLSILSQLPVPELQEYKRNIERYQDWFEPKLTISDGRMSVPKGPGVGIRDIAAVIRGAKQVV